MRQTIQILSPMGRHITIALTDELMVKEENVRHPQDVSITDFPDAVKTNFFHRDFREMHL